MLTGTYDNSNTSHVIIYPVTETIETDSHTFKYISCYYLSFMLVWDIYYVQIQIHLMLLFIGLSVADAIALREFKYISCYYLSLFPCLWYLIFASFKYISCYYLSKPKFFHINVKNHSNTSHVIIYQCRNRLISIALSIQIHLMLLFIKISRN